MTKWKYDSRKDNSEYSLVSSLGNWRNGGIANINSVRYCGENHSKLGKENLFGRPRLFNLGLLKMKSQFDTNWNKRTSDQLDINMQEGHQVGSPGQENEEFGGTSGVFFLK